MNGMPVIVTDADRQRPPVRALAWKNGRQTITGTFTMTSARKLKAVWLNRVLRWSA